MAWFADDGDDRRSGKRSGKHGRAAQRQRFDHAAGPISRRSRSAGLFGQKMP